MQYLQLFPLVLGTSLLLPALSIQGDGSSYNRVKAMMRDKLSPDLYDPQMRPLHNQSEVMRVNVTFAVMSIVGVDEVNQQFSANGVLALYWVDQLLVWNLSEFGAVSSYSPLPKSIWRPRMFLVNTVDKRDPFEDDYSPLDVFYNGTVSWMPGGVLTTYCALDMTRFPFDQHDCSLRFCCMSEMLDSLEFVPETEEVDHKLYIRNEGWILTRARVHVENLPAVSCPQISFSIRRRPVVYVVNYILPIILLSLLNNCVFLIPAHSGEKVSYAITVLMSLSLFLSTTRSMLPKSASSLPSVTIYIVSQLISGVITVIITIVSAVLHQAAQTAEQTDPGNQSRQPETVPSEASGIRSPMVKDDACQNKYCLKGHESKKLDKESVSRAIKIKFVSRHIDKVCFVLFMTLWACATLLYVNTVYWP